MKKIFSSLIFIILLVLIIPLTSNAAVQFTPKENPVSPHKQWEVTFNQSVDNEMISEETVYVLDDKGNLQATKSFLRTDNPKVLVVLAPKEGYIEGRSYKLHISDSLKSIAGMELTESVEMKFFIKMNNIQEFILGTWNGNYLGLIFDAKFNRDYTSVVNFGNEVEDGIYSISGNNMTMTLINLTRTGRVDQISPNEFTITSASGKVMRFTK